MPYLYVRQSVRKYGVAAGLLLFCFGFRAVCAAQQRTFSIPNGSSHYTATITVAGCPDNYCRGRGTVQLFDKQTKRLAHTFSSEDLTFFLDPPRHQPTVNVVQLYNEQSPLIFADFNFDGTEDLAIRNGNNSGYGGPSYDVYVFTSRSRRFIRSRELTALATENLGMFQVDKKRQRLITFQKSGCCWHLTTEFAVVPGQGLVKMLTEEEDATTETMVVTTRRRVNGQWTTSVRKHPRQD
ncbi:XAC2610-related protein [Hymenobacter weizhouensis]|uniref:XAC2610-related protein n=1 Tax=Hymenobacter sp. YIM 151500-1 TaxID=2987689 RepID=UPI002225F20A|nr:hypothetical protein [Hymenobacter sp. YIM 151500-1]UYZ64211.1 hypothetical protein OIS53_05030 [Hymenobacter sp. YIM 151500-1]